MKWNRFIFVILVLFFATSSVHAQGCTSCSYPDSLIKWKLNFAIGVPTSLYVGSIAYLTTVWFEDTDRVPFHYVNDNSGYLQVDKMGHFFGSYVESKSSYQMYREAGVSKKKALLYGGTMGLLFQTPIEIFDGIYSGWGFSWGDMIANTSGSALLIGQELLFSEQIVNYKFSFRRSSYADQSNGLLGDDFLSSLFKDYNGHSYWFSTNMNKLLPWKQRVKLQKWIPNWLNLAVGYSADGMFGEFENKKNWKGEKLPETERYRQFFLSLDIDWTEIPTDKYWLNQVFQAMNFIKVPAPAIEYNTLHKWKFHAFYY